RLLCFHSFPTRRSSDLNVDIDFLRAIDDAIQTLPFVIQHLKRRVWQFIDQHTIAEYGNAMENHMFGWIKDKLIDRRKLQCTRLLDRKSTRLNSSHVKIS